MAGDNDGWTRVKPSKWANHLRSANKAANLPGPPGPRPESANQAVVDQLRHDFDTIRSDLDACFSQDELRGIFAAYVAAYSQSGQHPVTQIVCFGIGCFDHPDGNWQAKRASYCQLAALLLIAAELEKTREGKAFNIIFQEPAFNVNDIAFIKSLGHTVVDAPEGNKHINANTLFYGPHLYYQLYAEALQGALPVIYVGSGIDFWELNTHFLPANHPVTMAPLKKIFTEYQRFEFPEVKSGLIFYKTYICLRPPKAEGEADSEAELCTRMSVL
ncbi:hypothetical protein J3F83DRAFT_717994 [Trichoderma novae-zelandiae]